MLSENLIEESTISKKVEDTCNSHKKAEMTLTFGMFHFSENF